jgi:predicted DNA-binding ribbon-helix-helix protein
VIACLLGIFVASSADIPSKFDELLSVSDSLGGETTIFGPADEIVHVTPATQAPSNKQGSAIMLDAALLSSVHPTEPEIRDLAVNGDTLRFALESSYWFAMEDIAEREGISLDELIDTLRIRVSRKLQVPAAEVSMQILVSAIHVLVVSYFRHAASAGRPTLMEEALLDMAPHTLDLTIQ